MAGAPRARDRDARRTRSAIDSRPSASKTRSTATPSGSRTVSGVVPSVRPCRLTRAPEGLDRTSTGMRAGRRAPGTEARAGGGETAATVGPGGGSARRGRADAAGHRAGSRRAPGWAQRRGGVARCPLGATGGSVSERDARDEAGARAPRGRRVAAPAARAARDAGRAFPALTASRASTDLAHAAPADPPALLAIIRATRSASGGGERSVRALRGKPGDGREEMRGEDVGRARAAEGRRPEEQLVEEHPQRIDVAPSILTLSGGLLRRHVVRRSEDESGGGLPCVAGAGQLPAAHRGLGQPGDAEVDHLHPFGAEEHVLRLHVPVEDAPAMRGGERAGDVADQRHASAGAIGPWRDSRRASVSPSTSSIAR